MNTDSLLMHGCYHESEDLTGWWLTEKYDGFRAYWDGKTLWTRGGHDYHAPTWFTRDLPRIPLDCELYAGPGNRTMMNGINRTVSDALWHDLTLMVFDAPTVRGFYNERLVVARERVVVDLRAINKIRARTVDAVLCKSMEHARDVLRQIQRRGGEGLVAYHPKCFYAPCRTHGVLKFIHRPPGLLDG